MFDFDKPVNREHTGSVKWDLREEMFGTKEVLPMWVADMDFETPECIVNAVKERAAHPVYGYPFMTDGYFEAFMNWVKRRHGWEVKKDEIVFSPGIVTAVNAAVLAFSEPGDGVIVQTPVYFPFFSAIRHNNRRQLNNRLLYVDNTYKIDFDDFEAKAKEAKVFLMSSPHNPVSRCWTEEELKRVGEICLENDVIIVSDEIHADLILPGYKHTPTAMISKELAEITVTCMAPSKTFNVAGFFTSQIVIGNEALRKRFVSSMETMHLVHGNIFGYVASEAGYNGGDQWLDAMMKYVKGNFDLVDEFLRTELPAVTLTKPEATFLAWLDFSGTGYSGKKLVEKVVTDAKLGLSPGRVFGAGGENFMRMNLGTRRSLVEEALKRLKKAFS
jgi:cystathionine beta-lyase